MAISKYDIKQARDRLTARGEYPSIDAILAITGGSKSTVHKYLHQLERDEGGTAGISRELQEMVTKMTAQMHAEAYTQVKQLRTAQEEKDRRAADALAAEREETARLREQLQSIGAALKKEESTHAATRDAYHQETIARHRAEQQVAGLKEQLKENNALRAESEKQRDNAEKASDHFRAATKAQRDQDQRRHEGQMQQLQAELRQAQQSIAVKQEEVTKLNKEGARLIAELTHTRDELRREKDHGQRLTLQIDELRGIDQRNKVLEGYIVDKDGAALLLRDKLAVSEAREQALTGKVHELEVALAQAQSRLDAQQGLVAELRTYLEGRAKPASRKQTPPVG